MTSGSRHPDTSNGQVDGGYCPCCKRYSGFDPVCPYCDADCPDTRIRRVLKRSALVIAIGGLAVLYLLIAMRATA